MDSGFGIKDFMGRRVVDDLENRIIGISKDLDLERPSEIDIKLIGTGMSVVSILGLSTFTFKVDNGFDGRM